MVATCGSPFLLKEVANKENERDELQPIWDLGHRLVEELVCCVNVVVE